MMHLSEESINNYLNQIARLLKKQHLPENLPEGVVELLIVLDRSGSIVSKKIIKSSEEKLENFIEKIILENSPYGDFPEDYLGTYVDFILPFVFK